MSAAEITAVGVVGGGAWGTALAIHCARMGHKVTLWARESEVVEAVNGPARENSVFLRGHPVPDTMSASGDLAKVVATTKLLLVVVPTPFVAATLMPVADALAASDSVIVSCTKGILGETLETPDDILRRVLPSAQHGRLAYLSGPSFAAEVAKELPTVVTIAAQDEAVAAHVQRLLSTARFRCYRTTDVAGVEMGGALKNVLAIASGISDGLGLGCNARAALITRGLAEITRLAVAKGGFPLTMGGLAGMGDLVLTCTGDLSRNRTVGVRIGQGEALADITASMGGAVAEGVLTSAAANALAKSLGVEAPIIEGIYKVIHEGQSALEVLNDIMTRELKSEVDERVMAALVSAVPAE